MIHDSLGERFTPEQAEYLKGFFAGVNRRADGAGFVGSTVGGLLTHDPANATGVHGVPFDELCNEELIKHEKHGLDVWEDMLDHAARDRFPEGGDVFRWKFHGLFYVTPAQESLMLRCRIPGGVLSSHQMVKLADLAEQFGGGYAHVTTRANIQIREIRPQNSVDILLGLREAGLTSQGAGADNVRNITASPTSGFDPDEAMDVLPLAKSMHHYILNTREMYDLPRKFNISFDSGGSVSVCADTNDIAAYALHMKPGATESLADWPQEESVGFRIQLCGITGHRQFASDSGLLLTARECVPVMAAMLRVFRKHGDRTNRKKARLKYLVDDWGVEKFLEATEAELAFPLRRASPDLCEPRRAIDKLGYLGVHPQRQDGLHFLGIGLPVGRLEPAQMRGLAAIAEDFGGGELRFTVWQSLIIPGIATAAIADARAKLAALGLSDDAHPLAAGMIACTGNRGCKYSSTDTKGHAGILAQRLRGLSGFDDPVNIHFTGCPHSCAQHYIGDIGLLGCKVPRGDDKVEGYHIVLGGGVDDRQAIANDVFEAVPFDEVPAMIERLLIIYQEKRIPDETFAAFTRRHTKPELVELFASSQPV